MRDALGRVDTVALVGASSDIAIAAARALQERGTRRFILAGRPSEGRSQARRMLGTDITEVDLDLRESSALEAATDDIFGHGDVDVVILAGGRLIQGPSPREAIEMAEVNYVGTLGLLLACADRLASQGHGQLIVLSSAGVTRPRPANFAYGSSKAAIDFAARGLSLTVRERGVTVTVVRPSFVFTKMTAGMPPSPLAVRPEKVGEAIAQAVADRTEGVVWVPAAVAGLARLLQVLPAAVVRRMDR